MPRDDAYVLDILLAARDAQAFCDSISWEKFSESRLHQYALVKALEIIGEAANKLSPEFKQSHPEIPWRDMIGLRHRLVHDYVNVDVAKVWSVATQEIPKLISAVEPLVPPAG